MDIVFQLLLFFVLTSAFLQPGLPLELPQSPRENEQTQADITISIDDREQIFLNDLPSSLEEVESAMLALSRERPQAAVILRGDRRVSYSGFFEVLDTVRGAGITRITLAYAEQDP
jgi:biopolymer transport protein ExbD